MADTLATPIGRGGELQRWQLGELALPDIARDFAMVTPERIQLTNHNLKFNRTFL